MKFLEDRAGWDLVGLIAGLAIGWLLSGPTTAHGADRLILNDGRVPTYVYTLPVEEVIFNWDHALEDRGPEKGIRFKEQLSAYLEGLVHGFYVAAENVNRDHGIPIFCLGDRHTILGGEVIQMLKEYENINPGANVWPFQAAVYQYPPAILPVPKPSRGQISDWAAEATAARRA